MVEPIAVAVAVAGKVVSLLFDQVVEATKIAISRNKCCKVLHEVLEDLQPIVDHAVRHISQSNFGNAFKRPRSAVHDWLDELEVTLKRAAVEVNTCIQQQADLNPVSRYKTGKRILELTKSVKKLLHQASLVGLAVAMSESSRAQKMEKMMEEFHEMMYDLRSSTLRIEFATVTQKSLGRAPTSSAEVITSDIKSALHHLLQGLSLGPSDNMTRVDTGASSSSSCPLESMVNEATHQLTDIKEVPRHVFGLDNLAMRLQQSITSSSTDAEPRCVGVWGMGGAGKTLLARIAYNSREVREHFKVDKLIWLTVSQTPNVKGLYDSLCRQLGLTPMDFPQLDEYRTRLYNMFLRMRVFLVLDDVWNKDLEQLDLAKGRGSVTLVTTRKQPVLEQAGVKDEDEVKVRCLSKEDSMKLFSVHAFPRRPSNIPCKLQGVSELVAEECKGLPLALMVIGGSMVGKTTREEREFQLNRLRDSSKLPEEDEKRLFGRLKLSYDNLDKDSPVGKECFLGFAAFPEDHMVEMEELIKLWKAQGLLVPTYMGECPTQLAYYLVGLLIGCSMIEVVEYSGACKVHDVMRDLALHIIKDQRPITCLYRPGKKLVEFPRDWIQTYEWQPCEVRNLSLLRNDLTLNGVTFSAPKLEVLLLSSNLQLETMPKQFLKGIENLKVLDLSSCWKLKSLPGEIGNLGKLTHLYLRNCRGLETLPREIGKLTQLTHLNLQSCFTLRKLPKSMVDLRSLQDLNLTGTASYWIWGKRSKNDQSFAAADICKLTTLTTLHISGRPCKSLVCDQLSELASKLVKLRKFRMNLFDKLETLPGGIQSMVHLEEFGLTSCKGIKILPQNITLFSKLKMLLLEFMKSLESLPGLNTLKFLSTLSIVRCTSMKKFPVSFTSKNAFPSLQILKCSRSGLVEFSEVEEGAMPKLEILDLAGTNMTSLPDTLINVKNLQILDLDGTNMKNLPDTLINLKNLKVVYIGEDRFGDVCKNIENTCLLSKLSSSRRNTEINLDGENFYN